MSGGPVEPIPLEAILGASDWDDEDLLTVAEASQRLGAEINASRRRIRQAEEALAEDDSPAIGAVDAAVLAAECLRLQQLVRAAERIQRGQADAQTGP
jgi:hypothetical protein